MPASQGCKGVKKGRCFWLNDKPALFIGYFFTLRLVTFAASELFVSFGDVALGTVLRLFSQEGPSAGPTLKVNISES